MNLFPLVLLVLVGCCTIGHTAEPLYNGKPESYWINNLTNKDAEELLALLGDKQTWILLKASAKQAGPDAAYIRAKADAILSKQGNIAVLFPFAQNDSELELQKSATGVFVRWLQHTDPNYRAIAAFSLKELPHGWDAAWAELIKALTNTNPAIKEAAGQALRAMRGTEGVEQALEIFDQESYHAWAKESGRSWDTTVKVVDEAGTPLQAAEVWIPWREKRHWESADPSGASAKWAEFGRTGPEGIFKAFGLCLAPLVTIHARKTGYTSVSVERHPPFSVESGGPPAGKRELPTVFLVLKKAPTVPGQKVGLPEKR